MGAAEVGDVEALDPHRRHVEAERPLQPLERLHAALAAALGAQVLLVERQARVALGELEDAALVAALGRAQLDGTAAAAGERLGEVSARRARRPPPWRSRCTSSRCTTICAGIEVWPA